jgi:hypothetical protein
MASLFSKFFSMFSSGGAPVSQAPAAEPQSHAGCTIYAEPMREGSQYRLAGRIEKQVEGKVMTRSFVRADMFTSMDDALECTFRKARQIIDQNGAALFADGVDNRSA